jgi:hypothetical protein
MENLTEEKINKIISLYKEGVIVNKIIEIIGINISRREIYVVLQKNGINSNRKGIVSYKDSEKKECSKCKIIKPLENFHKSKISSDGYKSNCKECKKKESSLYRNLPEYKEKRKKEYQNNKKFFRDRMNKYLYSLVGQYHNYKKRAKRDNIIFELSKEDCKIYYETNCYYCGDKIKGIGIDRVDNLKGYVIDNCVPCCSECNFMKRTQTKKDFFLRIEKIYLNHKK